MEELFKSLTGHVALGIEAAAVIIIACGAIQAILRLFQGVKEPDGIGNRKRTWRGFAVWLLMGLEFTLAADILRTAITPTWNDIGQLASIAVIRTFLNYFLEKDLEKESAKEPGGTIKEVA